jgi:chitinase
MVTEGDPYAYAGNQWVGFDSIESVRRKAEYIKSSGFGGAMIWSVDMDDFSNMCCLEAFPLLRTVARSLGLRSDSAPPAGNCNPPPPPVTTSTEKPTTPYDSGNFELNKKLKLNFEF